ncbi:MAG: S46 family peptidase, partial [Croceimicrobium sp.]
IQEYGDFLYSKSIFVDEEKMNKLLANPSKSALLKIRKKDAAYHFMRSFYDMYEEKVYHPYHGLNNDIQAQLSTYMKALMEVMPNNNYFPDANSTLRLAHGKVSATVPQDAVEFDYYTTLDGILAKYVPGDSEFDLPEKLITLHKNKDYGDYAHSDGSMRVCFIASNHTTGGNSGSPVLNKDGHLVGLNFDRSWESTMSDYVYDSQLCRNIAVDARYILFVIDKYAGASNLINEIKLVK